KQRPLSSPLIRLWLLRWVMNTSRGNNGSEPPRPTGPPSSLIRMMTRYTPNWGTPCTVWDFTMRLIWNIGELKKLPGRSSSQLSVISQVIATDHGPGTTDGRPRPTEYGPLTTNHRPLTTDY